MKNLNLVIVALVVLSSCNNTSKKADTSSPVETKVETVATEKRELSPEDYNVFLGAAFNNQEDIVKEYLTKGIDVNYTEENMQTALMLASFNGYAKIVKMLIDAGANIKAKNVNNRTALMLASSGPFVETVKMLLEAGAEVNATDSHESWTPLMFAAGEGQIEVAKVLMAAGADITMVDIDGESSYDFAVSRGHTEMANYLKEIAQRKK